MRRLVTLSLALLGLASATVSCHEEAPPRVYQFQVRGVGENVRVVYGTLQAGMLEETVDLPWTSDEFQGDSETSYHLEANGPQGSEVTCVVRYRRPGGTYGGNGSGSTGQHADQPDEDHTICSL